VLAQRLLRRICPHCDREDALAGAERAWVQACLGGGTPAFRRGEGCHQCNNTGYRGRLGVYEMLEFDTAMSQALARSDLAGFATLARASRGYRPLALAALDYAAQGLTTVAEAMRIAADGAREVEAIDDLADARAA
jgi:MSHA biogenesis protein MshE